MVGRRDREWQGRWEVSSDGQTAVAEVDDEESGPTEGWTDDESYCGDVGACDRDLECCPNRSLAATPWWRRMLDRILPARFVPMAREFLDDHEEVHALATGLGLGFTAVASGESRMLGVAATILAQGLERGRRPAPAERQDLVNDIKRELHYFAFGLFVGGVLGVVAAPFVNATV